MFDSLQLEQPNQDRRTTKLGNLLLAALTGLQKLLEVVKHISLWWIFASTESGFPSARAATPRH
jgi:hypothetical protein